MTLTDAPKQIYWDSCAWIGLLCSEQDKITALRSIWEDAKAGKYEIWTSVYAYLEVIHSKAPYGEAYPPESDDKKVEDILSQEFVIRVQIDVSVARLAKKLKRDLHHKGLKKRSDAIHLATALYYNSEELHTWDASDLLQFDNQLKCKNGNNLKIIIPAADKMHVPLFAQMHLPKMPRIDDKK